MILADFAHVLQNVTDAFLHIGFQPSPGPAVPNPGGGEMPPGEIGEKVLLILKWVAALCTAACVGGVIYTGGRMAIAHRRGDETNIAQLGWVLFACLLIGSAWAIVTALIYGRLPMSTYPQLAKHLRRLSGPNIPRSGSDSARLRLPSLQHISRR